MHKRAALLKSARNVQMGRVFNRWRSRAQGRAGARAVTSMAGRVARRGLLKRFTRAIPYVGAAYEAGSAAYSLYKKFRGKKGRKKSQLYETMGKYGGNFKKVTRRGARSGWDKYNREGVVSVNEISGNLTDVDCVYLMNESVNSRDAIYYILAAMCRKIIEMAGGRVTGLADAVFPFSAGDVSSTGYIIRYIKQNQLSGVAVVKDFAVLAASTFGDVVQFFRGDMEEYCSGFGRLNNQNMDEPLSLSVITGVGGAQLTQSVILFNETFVEMKGLSEMKIQNRTKSSTGSEDAENVNNNPLQGKAYLFRGVPKPKGNVRAVGGTNDQAFAFERMQYPKGLTGFGGNSLGLGVDFREPPNASQFWNCSKLSKVRLEPGQIKSFFTSGFKVGNVLKILKSIRLQLDAGGAWSTYSIFPVQMVGLEDVLNASAVEAISVQYEVEKTLGVKCFVKQKKYYRTDFHAQF